MSGWAVFLVSWLLGSVLLALILALPRTLSRRRQDAADRAEARAIGRWKVRR